jgi:hypothetical protein
MAILTLVLLSTVLAFAQEDPSLDNSGPGSREDDLRKPIQIGYAVITPMAATTSGLVVFETFGMRWGWDLFQAGLLPSNLTTKAIFFVDSNGRLSKNVGVSLVNPNASAENVTLTLKNEDGTTLGTTTVNVPSHQQVAKFVTELFANHRSVPRDITGTLTVSSTNPIAVMGLRFRGITFSTLPITSLTPPAPVPVFSTGVGGPSAVLLSQFVTNGGWRTEIVIGNTGTTPLTVRVDLFKSDGTPLTTTILGKTASSFTDLVVPPGGVLVLGKEEDDDDDDHHF